MPACRSLAFRPCFAKAFREGKHAGMEFAYQIAIPLGKVLFMLISCTIFNGLHARCTESFLVSFHGRSEIMAHFSAAGC
jgi:hypothetical protein